VVVRAEPIGTVPSRLVAERVLLLPAEWADVGPVVAPVVGPEAAAGADDEPARPQTSQ
jgi:hypothetical protein